MIHLLLLFFMGLSPVFASAGNKEQPHLSKLQDRQNQQKKLSNDQESKNSLTLSLVNGVASAALIKRFFSSVPKSYYSGDSIRILCRPEIALTEVVCSTVSAIVDVKPSTANTIVGWGNVVWGGTKLVIYFTGDPLTSSITTAFYFSTIAVNGINAVYRLWYANKNTESVKK